MTKIAYVYSACPKFFSILHLTSFDPATGFRTSHYRGCANRGETMSRCMTRAVVSALTLVQQRDVPIVAQMLLNREWRYLANVMIAISANIVNNSRSHLCAIWWTSYADSVWSRNVIPALFPYRFIQGFKFTAKICIWTNFSVIYTYGLLFQALVVRMLLEVSGCHWAVEILTQAFLHHRWVSLFIFWLFYHFLFKHLSNQWIYVLRHSDYR